MLKPYVKIDISDKAKEVINNFTDKEKNIYNFLRQSIVNTQKVIQKSNVIKPFEEKTVNLFIDTMELLELFVDIESLPLSKNVKMTIISKEENDSKK